MYEPQHSRVKFLLEPIHNNGKEFHASFTFLASDPIMVQNPNRYDVILQRTLKNLP